MNLPDRSVRAALAGLEAAVFSWLTTALLAMVAYAATASAPGLGDATWGTAVGAGTQLWALGFGAEAPFGEGVFALTPLGVTLLAFLLLRGSLLRARLSSAAQVAIAGGAFVVAVAVLGLANGVPAGLHLLGALGVAAVAACSVLDLDGALPEALRSRLAGVPTDLWEGIRAGGWLTAGATALGLVLVIASVVAEFPRVAEINGAVSQDIISTVTFAAVQILFLPNAALWAASWTAGPGFVVGAGTLFSPTEVRTEPLPAIPLLGALPAPGAEPGLWVIVLPMVVGVVAAFWLQHHRPDPDGWSGIGLRAAAALVTAVVLLLVAVWMSTGPIGPGRMSEAGVLNPFAAAGALAGEMTLGFLLMLVVSHLLGLRGTQAEGFTGEPQAADREPAAEAETAPTAVTGPTAATALTAPTALTAEVPPESEDSEADADEDAPRKD